MNTVVIYNWRNRESDILFHLVSWSLWRLCPRASWKSTRSSWTAMDTEMNPCPSIANWSPSSGVASWIPWNDLEPAPLVIKCTELSCRLICSKQWSWPFMYRSTLCFSRIGSTCRTSSWVSPWRPRLLIVWCPTTIFHVATDDSNFEFKVSSWESKYSCRPPIPLQSNFLCSSLLQYLSTKGVVSMKKNSTNLSQEPAK